MKQILYIFLLGILVLPSAVHAETVLRLGHNLSVESGQVVDGDYYASVGPFGTTDMSGEVLGDALVLAGNAIVNGAISNDALVAAFTTQLNSTVGDDARILAGEATVSGDVAGDLFVLAGSVKVLSSAHIAGNVYVFGGDATIQGTIDGSLFGTMERLRVDGVIGKDVDVTVPAGLMLGDKAAVAGNVRYTSAGDLVRAQGSSVDGEVTKREAAPASEREATRSFLTPLFVLLFASLSLYLLFKRELIALVERISESPLYSIAVGAGVILAGPIAGVLLLFTVLGILLGAMLLGSLVFVYAAAVALAGVVAGAYIFKYTTGQLTVSPLSIVVGTAALQCALIVPLLGTALVTFVVMVTVGGLVRGLYHTLQT